VWLKGIELFGFPPSLDPSFEEVRRIGVALSAR